MKKKLVCMLLAVSMLAAQTGCGSTATDTAATDTSSDTAATTAAEQTTTETTETTEAAAAESSALDTSEMTYDEASAAVYDSVLGEFYEAYQTALACEDTSERFALMAIAEAKLYESAVMVPLNSLGGYYGISRVASYTSDYVLWGTDYCRYHSAVVTEELIKLSDRTVMKEKWAELKGTGTYLEWVKSYLTEQGYTLKDSYTIQYSTDPTSWDCLATYLMSNTNAIVNTYDGLMEYDCEGTLQPALAESYEVSDDGLTYTFHLREGVKWVDSQGREVGEVTADDFVAGMQHLLDAQGGMEYLIDGVITNVTEYLDGEITDFSEVGVTAVDDYTVEYTLTEPCSYFTTMLGFSVFAPMNRSYYESKGGKFGLEYDPSASDYTYGIDYNSIAYCGPYLVTNATANSTIVFKANESYWNYDNLDLKTITWLFNDYSDATKAYNDVIAGTIDSATLTDSNVTTAKEEGYFDDYVYTTANDGTSYMAFYNLNRTAFANYNDENTVVSTQSEEEAARTNAAMLNVHFRRAISYAFDRASYWSQMVGEDTKYIALRNTYTPANFVQTTEEVTVDINGTATTFAAGTYYGEMMQAQLDADGVKITVWDPDAEEGAGSGDGFDGWYNVENAVEELEIAIEELAAEGITVDAENPIQIDFPYDAAAEDYSNRANVYKQSLESALNGCVQVNLVACTTIDQWYYAGYYAASGTEANYDVYDLSGWSPDYGDPKTYLDTFLPDYAGYNTMRLGIY